MIILLSLHFNIWHLHFTDGVRENSCISGVGLRARFHCIGADRQSTSERNRMFGIMVWMAILVGVGNLHGSA
jgi:hypothetical protein